MSCVMFVLMDLCYVILFGVLVGFLVFILYIGVVVVIIFVVVVVMF